MTECRNITHNAMVFCRQVITEIKLWDGWIPLLQQCDILIYKRKTCCRGRSLYKFKITAIYLTLFFSSKRKDLLLLSGRNFKILSTNNVLS